ncbi:CAPA peptides [Maniola hyperantus]|uniref:CAPA peptides n=1 Tax=Aphantopus hyperantus TaxID=2795564 RepID=UPI001568FA10|nr:CAPA peptides-like [Maniola hyperantus]
MQCTTRYALSILLLSSVVSSSYHSSAKLRRDGVLNLYPFPRVGRAGSRTWQFDDPAPIKRQLYAFPRVGRSEQSHPDYQLSPQLEELLFGRQNPFVKRQSFKQMEGKDTSGMWFGPRLGRSFKSEDDDISEADAEKSEPEQLENTNMDREKRQTKHT